MNSQLVGLSKIEARDWGMGTTSFTNGSTISGNFAGVRSRDTNTVLYAATLTYLKKQLRCEGKRSRHN